MNYDYDGVYSSDKLGLRWQFSLIKNSPGDGKSIFLVKSTARNPNVITGGNLLNTST